MSTSPRPRRQQPEGDRGHLLRAIRPPANDLESRRVRDVRGLQRAAGNRAVTRLLGADATSEGANAPTGRVAARAVSTALVEAGSGRGPGSTEHAVHTPDTVARSKIGITKVAPNATALGQLGPDYGITWPQDVRLTLNAKLEGDTWVPSVTDLTGDYSVQATLLPHQTDVPDASVATLANYQQILAALDNLGDPGHAHNWYSLKAVQAHESRHATRALQALMDVREAIENRMAQVTVPRANNQETALQAVARIQAAPGYALALQQCFTLWDNRFDVLINGDHTGDGPCETAERSITVPIANAIRERAKTERWLAPPPMVPLF